MCVSLVNGFGRGKNLEPCGEYWKMLVADTCNHYTVDLVFVTYVLHWTRASTTIYCTLLYFLDYLSTRMKGFCR